MSFAIEGFGAIAQNFIDSSVASNFYTRTPFLSALGAFTLSRNNKTSTNIGRPGGEWLSGRVITPADKMMMQTMNAYTTRVQRFETDNSKWMGARDTNPTVANPTTNSHGQATQASAVFYRARLKTPILIWHVDKNRAAKEGTAKGRGITMAKIIEEATDVAYQEHVTKLNTGIRSGNPADQAMDPWDSPLGIDQMFSATNIYGNVSRAPTANAGWRAQIDSSFTTPDIAKIIDDASVNKNIVDLTGRAPDLAITTKALYLTFKAQLRSQGKQNFEILNNGLPKQLQLGVTQECLKVDNTYVMYDSAVSANCVELHMMDTWQFIVAPDANLTISKFVDLSDKAEGAKEADQAFVTTEFFLANKNPKLNVKYTSIGAA